MAKFCGKCGSPLDEKTGLCPNCDAEKIAAQKRGAGFPQGKPLSEKDDIITYTILYI